jgi:hypothetical protein
LSPTRIARPQEYDCVVVLLKYRLCRSESNTFVGAGNQYTFDVTFLAVWLN